MPISQLYESLTSDGLFFSFSLGYQRFIVNLVSRAEVFIMIKLCQKNIAASSIFWFYKLLPQTKHSNTSPMTYQWIWHAHPSWGPWAMCHKGLIFSYKLRYIADFGLMIVISTNPKPTIYRNLYQNTGPGSMCINMVYNDNGKSILSLIAPRSLFWHWLPLIFRGWSVFWLCTDSWSIYPKHIRAVYRWYIEDVYYVHIR